MINRVLIRLKAIQILYSYVLVEKQFTLEQPAESPTKEKRFAYSVYMDMLVLMLRISRMINRRGGESPLAEVRFIKRLQADDQIKSFVARYRMSPFPFQNAEDELADKIKDSALYKNFLKNRDSGESGAEMNIWRDIFNLIIAVNPKVNAAIENRENYTVKGVERMRQLMESTFANFMESQDDGTAASKALTLSLDKARELYIRLLLLPVELTEIRAGIIEDKRNRPVLRDEDKNPNLRFVENSLVEDLRNCESFANIVENGKYSWMPDDMLMLRSLLREIMTSDLYREYMEAPLVDRHADYEFWRNIYRRIIFNSESFLETLEDKSVFWNDDLHIIGTFVLKTLKKLEEGESHPVLDKFKDEEDSRFGFELIRQVLKNKEDYRQLIDEALRRQEWDSERLAFMDVLIIETALAEILNFPKIPLRVSINEYVEIAKYYSTAKSGQFVNGLLSAVLRNLQENGKLQKA